MQSQTIAGIVLSCCFVAVLASYLLSWSVVTRDTIIFLLSMLQIVSLFFVFFRLEKEGFFFEVSPERKRCLEEQVSLHSHQRSCSCCQKGTVGGYPPGYKEWLTDDPSSGTWNRTDNWSTSEDNIAVQTQLPPTQRVKKIRWKSQS